MTTLQKYYVVPDIANGVLPTATFNTNGAIEKSVSFNFVQGIADANNSIYMLWKDVDTTIIPIALSIYNPALTSANDWDIGFYNRNLGAAWVNPASVDMSDRLADGLDLSAAHALNAPLAALGGGNGANQIGVADYGKMLWELMGFTILNRPLVVDIGLKMLTANTVGGNIAGRLVYINQ